jgi:hypothetical protein
VRVADLHRALSLEPPESRAPGALRGLLEKLLPLAPGERFDALLAWDLFDHLRPDQVLALMAHLAPALPPGARALVLTSVRRQPPAAPLTYRILDRETLIADGALEPARGARPRAQQPDVRRLMPGFAVRHGVLLRSGVQEYLLVRDAADQAKGPDGAPLPRPTWFRRGSL